MKVEEMTPAVIDQIFRGIDVAKLPDEWTTKFIASTKVWWVQKRKLSPKQLKRLGEIWEKQNEPKTR